jgi:hypothetical protein
MIKINLVKWLSNLITTFIGTGIGVCVGLWFRLPNHTVDVFSFVESALGIGLTVIALIVTLGVIQQRAAMETMLATKRDEMVAEAKVKLEADTFTPFRNQHLQDFLQLKGQVETMKISFDTNLSSFAQLDGKIKQLESRLVTLENSARH